MRDIENTKHHGIFISEHSGIVGKHNFQIDIHNKNILIYIHNCDYDIEKIKLAINTIDTLSNKLIDLNTDNKSISVDLIKNINIDYQTFLIQRDNLLNNIKDNYKKTLDILTNMKLPTLEIYLSTYFADNKKICTHCKIYETDNLRSLARHTNTCKNKLHETIDDTVSDTTSDNIPDENIKHTKKNQIYLKKSY